MKNRSSFCIYLGLFCAFSLIVPRLAFAEVSIDVLNPRGEVELEKTLGISPRLTDLADKTIGLYDNGKGCFTEFLDVIEGLLKQKYPTSTVKRYNGAFDLGDRLASRIAKEVDAVIYGSGD